MGQQEYDAFKEQLKQWIADNQEDYNEFEDMMNELPDEGYDSIVSRSAKLISQFKGMVQSKCNTAENLDLSDIIEVAQSEGLAEKLLGEFHRKDSDNFIPAMLCWLYFGRSWEGMVEHGEDILKRPSTNWFQKIYISFGLKMLVKTSIINEFRTQEDWNKYKRLRSIINGENIVDWAIENSDDGNLKTLTLDIIKPQGKFALMLITRDDQRIILLERIKNYLNTSAKGKAVALMILALQQLNYLPKIQSDRAVFDAMRAEFSKDIGSNTAIYRFLEPANSRNFEVEVSHLVRRFKVE